MYHVPRINNHAPFVCSKLPLECLYEKQYDMAGNADQPFVVFFENAPYLSYGSLRYCVVMAFGHNYKHAFV